MGVMMEIIMKRPATLAEVELVTNGCDDGDYNEELMLLGLFIIISIITPRSGISYKWV